MCGVASRRKAEEFISAGQVTVNGEKATLGTKVDPDQDRVICRGELLSRVKVTYYVVLNKPKGFLTSVGDPFGRRTVVDLIPEKYWEAGVFPVGRLDKDTEGLLLLTNDGILAHRLMHPSFESKKTYSVTLDRELDEKDKGAIEKGVRLREFSTRPCTIVKDKDLPERLQITIGEGKKRQIRLTFAHFRYKVKKLVRLEFGPLKLAHIPKGTFRDLKGSEVRALKKYARID